MHDLFAGSHTFSVAIFCKLSCLFKIQPSFDRSLHCKALGGGGCFLGGVVLFFECKIGGVQERETALYITEQLEVLYIIIYIFHKIIHVEESVS